jgi:hypothetical protein
VTTYPKELGIRFAATIADLINRVRLLENRTRNIDSGTLLQTLTGTVDPAYTGSGAPNVQITGATSLSGPYQAVSGYQPTAGDTVLLIPSGATYVVAGLVHPTVYRSYLSTSTTVANTSTETVIASMTIPAGDAVAGAVYRMAAWGIGSVTATPTITLRSRLGGVTGQQIASSGARTASSGVSGHTWRVDLDLVCLTTGTSGSWFGQQVTMEAISVPGAGAPYAPAVIQDGTVQVTADSTVAQTLVLTATWGTASVSNTITCEGFTATRAA